MFLKGIEKFCLLKPVLAFSLACTLAFPVAALPPEDWDPPDPQVFYYQAGDGSGWVQTDGVAFVTKLTAVGLRVNTQFTSPPAFLGVGESCSFTMVLTYGGESASLTGLLAGTGDVTIQHVSANFGALSSRFSQDHPELASWQGPEPNSVWDCLRAVSWALLASAGVAGGCGSGNPILCAGAVAGYVRALGGVSSSCLFV